MRQTVSQAFKQCSRVVSLVMVAWASIGPVGNISARSRRVRKRPIIRVEIYNYADITRLELSEAEHQAAAVFAEAGVQITWLEHPHKSVSLWLRRDNSPADFFVRILYASATRRLRQISGIDVMGESIIPSGTEGPLPGGIANVYYDRVKEVSSAWGPISGAVLGEAIAHELGHLMLGRRHSRRGIMKVLWTPRDQGLITHCELRFLPAQAVSLQRAARSLDRNPSPTLVALR